jgi:2-dehydro-3-deoxyphosphogluconate aldolase / (4S)-4-hydroxy-2-oxoglutarate aldolase
MREDIIQLVKAVKIIAIVRGQGEEALIPLAEALYAGGIRMLEVTFSQKDPASWKSTGISIATLKNRLSGKMRFGAGTVMNADQLEIARSAGAEYIVSPGADARIIAETRRLGLVSMPGAMTPTEIAMAYEAGADFVKVFPAGALGAAYIQSIRAPLPHIPMLAVGGINQENAASFLAAGALGLGIGGNLVSGEWIRQGRFDLITQTAAGYVKKVMG